MSSKSALRRPLVHSSLLDGPSSPSPPGSPSPSPSGSSDPSLQGSSNPLPSGPSMRPTLGSFDQSSLRSGGPFDRYLDMSLDRCSSRSRERVRIRQKIARRMAVDRYVVDLPVSPDAFKRACDIYACAPLRLDDDAIAALESLFGLQHVQWVRPGHREMAIEKKFRVELERALSRMGAYDLAIGVNGHVAIFRPGVPLPTMPDHLRWVKTAHDHGPIRLEHDVADTTGIGAAVGDPTNPLRPDPDETS